MRFLPLLLSLSSCTCVEPAPHERPVEKAQEKLAKTEHSVLFTGLLTGGEAPAFVPCKGPGLYQVTSQESVLADIDAKVKAQGGAQRAVFARLEGTFNRKAVIEGDRTYDGRLTVTEISQVRPIEPGDCGLTSLDLPPRVDPVEVSVQGTETDGLARGRLVFAEASPTTVIGAGTTQLAAAWATPIELTAVWCNRPGDHRRPAARIEWDVYDQGGERYLGHPTFLCANARVFVQRFGRAEQAERAVVVDGSATTWKVWPIVLDDAAAALDYGRRLEKWKRPCDGERCPFDHAPAPE